MHPTAKPFSTFYIKVHSQQVQLGLLCLYFCLFSQCYFRYFATTDGHRN